MRAPRPPKGSLPLCLSFCSHFPTPLESALLPRPRTIRNAVDQFTRYRQHSVNLIDCIVWHAWALCAHLLPHAGEV